MSLLATDVFAQPGMARFDLNGRWRIENSAAGEPTWAVVDIVEQDDHTSIKVLDSNRMFGNPFHQPRISLARSDTAVVILMTAYQGDITFSAILDRRAPANRVAGVVQLALGMSPLALISSGSLQRTQEASIPPDLEPDPRDEAASKPNASAGLAFLLQRQKAVAILQEKALVPLNYQVAKIAYDEVPVDEVTETLAWNTRRWIEASRKVDRPDTTAETSLTRLTAMIAAEQRNGDQPLVIPPFSGRKVSGSDRVVVIEHFTGADCGACIHADKAFDALNTSFQSTELITLQYHVHIPGPDPLANAGSVTVQSAYGVASAPSTFFNGKQRASYGGGMSNPAKTLNQFQRVIEQGLQGRKQAEIELEVQRVGDEIRVKAWAKRLNAQECDDPAKEARLRLVLIEAVVPYVGANRLPLHHNVVRGLIGRLEGQAFTRGEIRVEEVIKLGDIRSGLNEYLAKYPTLPGTRGPFTEPLPPIALEKLSIVAMVSGVDHEILHAVRVLVPEN